ncbi:hypothetical protein TCDM_08400 [Trypanosoma cruzi Dm28c]|uniref:Uncharacterized protein n=1 Tax=Trypanosoma cruzi Dm28c TaxID=1416333 RepID=V5BGV9_TRYCR|nr:hypothetical protein TCDM_08400 [Trypanosoma cruzi Dm28c]
MPIVSYLWTRRIHVQRTQHDQRKLLAAQMVVKKWQRGCPPLIGAEDGSPIQPATSHQSSQAAHRAADAPPDLSNCPTKSSRRAMELIRQRRSTVVRRITDIPALGQPHEERERGRSRDVGAVNVEAENVPSGAIHNLMPHARTDDERGELRGLFDGNIRCGAIDPTAVRQDAAVYVGNGSNPAGHGDSGVTKSCGTIGDETGAPIDRGRDESSNPQSDRLEGTCCLTTCVGNDDSLVRDCRLNPNSNSTMEADGTLILDWSVAPKTARADPHRASRFVRIRGQDAFDTIKLCRTFQENEKLTNLTTAQVERALDPWNATAHSIKRGALRHAAQIVETYNLDPHLISQLAKHVDPFDLPQNTV